MKALYFVYFGVTTEHLVTDEMVTDPITGEEVVITVTTLALRIRYESKKYERYLTEEQYLKWREALETRDDVDVYHIIRYHISDTQTIHCVGMDESLVVDKTLLK